MPKCTFCGNQMEKGTGKMFVYVTGKIDYYCSSKCDKNAQNLRRDPLHVRWTEPYRREHHKGMATGTSSSKKAQRSGRKEEKAAIPAESGQ